MILIHQDSNLNTHATGMMFPNKNISCHCKIGGLSWHHMTSAWGVRKQLQYPFLWANKKCVRTRSLLHCHSLLQKNESKLSGALPKPKKGTGMCTIHDTWHFFGWRFINVHQCASMFINVHQCSSIFISFHQFSRMFIRSFLPPWLRSSWKVQADICCRADNIGGKGLQEGPGDLSYPRHPQVLTISIWEFSWGYLEMGRL